MEQEILNSYSRLNSLNVSRETYLDFELFLSMIIEKNKEINIISQETAKPPIFWKDKEITKQQIYKWTPENIKQLIYKLSEIELLIKKNINNSINLITDFILNEASSSTNN